MKSSQKSWVLSVPLDKTAKLNDCLKQLFKFCGSHFCGFFLTKSDDSTIDSRTRLLQAAGPVFACRGFRRATVREICSEANVNIASVGYYFGDKLGLYREVIAGLRKSRDASFPVPELRGDDPRADLLRLVQALLSRMLAPDDHGWESELMMREMQSPSPVFAEMIDDCFRPTFDRLRNAIRSTIGGDAKKDSNKLPDHCIDQLALSVIGQCLYYRIGSGVINILISDSDRQAHYDLESLSHHVTAVILAATENAALLNHKSTLEK